MPPVLKEGKWQKTASLYVNQIFVDYTASNYPFINRHYEIQVHSLLFWY